MVQVCPTCDAFVPGTSCVICGWKPAKRLTTGRPPAPSSTVLDLTAEERARGQAAVRATLGALAQDAVEESRGDCLCERTGALCESRVVAGRWYILCVTCGRRTGKHSTPREAQQAWHDGQMVESDLPWSYDPLEQDPRVAAHWRRLVGLGISEVQAAGLALDTVRQAGHGLTCPICAGVQ